RPVSVAVVGDDLVARGAVGLNEHGATGTGVAPVAEARAGRGREGGRGESGAGRERSAGGKAHTDESTHELDPLCHSIWSGCRGSRFARVVATASPADPASSRLSRESDPRAERT